MMRLLVLLLALCILVSSAPNYQNKDCQTGFPPSPHRTVTYKKGTATKKGPPYLHRTVAYAKCDPGYTRQGYHTSECQFGEWERELGKCV
ncbi:unnamed protein product [Heligmosomoides polygyrus]|uniref:Sushi domain-containing protein n=1 Tax=Heligmosomoides polygyrus TaxID=6339 RepID=A0A183FTC0_HELPZ|nr:unnamed protein product [Heligmosomoides polygyrus]